MYKTNFVESRNRKILEQHDGVTIFEYERDLNVTPSMAMQKYFESEMNVRSRQAVIQVSPDRPAIIQRGAMQMMVGNLSSKTNVRGAGDFVKKFASSKVTNESAIKPFYMGSGLLVLEPTHKHLIIEDLSKWNGMVVDDGLFLACDGSTNLQTVARKTLSSVVLGGEGLFNTCLTGNGYAVLESFAPREELLEVVLDDDVLRVDGNFAIAWSRSLDFTVEKSTKMFVGSAASGEGFVNVYRGTGRVLLNIV